MRRLLPRPDLWLFAALVCGWVFQSFVLLQGEQLFTMDAERDLLAVRAFLDGGGLPAHPLQLLTAHLLAEQPSPAIVHALNVAISVAGLCAMWWLLRVAAGPIAALGFAILYSQSTAHSVFIGTASHAAAAPGLVLALLASVGWWLRSGRAPALATMALLFAFLLPIDPPSASLDYSLLTARFVLSETLTPLLTLGFAAWGVIETLAMLRRREFDPLRLMLLALLVAGGVAAQPLAVVAPLMALAAFGVAAADAALAARNRTPIGRVATFAAIAAFLVIFREGPNEARPPPDALSLYEQQTAVAYLVERRGMSGPDLWSKVHGTLHGTQSGIRYLEAVHGARRANKDPGEGHWLVLPAGLAAPPLDDDLLETKRIDGPGRGLVLFRYRPAFEPTPEQAQLIALRGVWSDPLRLELRLAPGATHVTVQLSDDGDGDRLPATARIRFGDLPFVGLALDAREGTDKLWLTAAIPAVQGADRTVELTIRPRGELRFLDVY